MKPIPLSYIEISKENLIQNIKQFRKLVGKKTEISAVVKANAYGHGDREVVRILNSQVDYFQINSVEELEKIRKITPKPILLFGYVGKNDLEKAIKIGCILTAFNFEHLLLINESARRLNKIQKVHLAIDSYLGREGFLPNDIEKLLPKFKSAPPAGGRRMKNIEIDGIYSHFANIEDSPNFSHAQKQLDTYQITCNMFQEYGYKNLKTHISATSGVLTKHVPKMSIVRLGIGLYGMWPSEYLKKMWRGKIILKPVLRWITHVAQVKILPPNHPIGYGLTYITKKKTKIAVIPQGYADGLPRALSNKGEVLIKGKKAKILGRVAMNMIVVDVSRIKNVQAEDEVIILGKQNKGEITAEEIAEKINTINYEITTRISSLLLRIIV